MHATTSADGTYAALLTVGSWRVYVSHAEAEETELGADGLPSHATAALDMATEGAHTQDTMLERKVYSISGAVLSAGCVSGGAYGRPSFTSQLNLSRLCHLNPASFHHIPQKGLPLSWSVGGLV